MKSSELFCFQIAASALLGFLNGACSDKCYLFHHFVEMKGLDTWEKGTCKTLLAPEERKKKGRTALNSYSWCYSLPLDASRCLKGNELVVDWSLPWPWLIPPAPLPNSSLPSELSLVLIIKIQLSHTSKNDLHTRSTGSDFLLFWTSNYSVPPN